MKRIYVVIEYNSYDVIAQGAFTDENAAIEAMEEWMKSSPSTRWEVYSCNLHE